MTEIITAKTILKNAYYMKKDSITKISYDFQYLNYSVNSLKSVNFSHNSLKFHCMD